MANTGTGRGWEEERGVEHRDTDEARRQCEESWLLRCAQALQPGTFEELRARLEPAAQRYVARLVGPKAASTLEAEIVQDAFVSLYVNLPRLDPPENLRPFLFRIVRNRCYDELRRQGRYNPVSLDASPALELRDPTAHGAPDAELQRVAAHGALLKTMTRLPERQRETLLLYALEDFSYEQISTATGTDVGTVKSRLYHARRNLERLLPTWAAETLGLAGPLRKGSRGKDHTHGD
jgi:RNA polymerase sigma-70 factor (ECF subfamily)